VVGSEFTLRGNAFLSTIDRFLPLPAAISAASPQSETEDHHKETQRLGRILAICEGVIPALFSGEKSAIFVDKLAHATIQAGARLAQASGTACRRVDARNLKQLEEAFRKLPADVDKKGLLVDGVYSMHGHVLPLREIQQLCRDYGVILYVDDAHGFGIFGKRGGGVVEEFELAYDNLIYVGSLNKGIGANGGFVAGKKEIIDILKGNALCFVFSDSVPPTTASAALAALNLSRTEEGDRRRKTLPPRRSPS
jgi:7-keto-8-aminopelargonate synthetase-like enzyme